MVVGFFSRCPVSLASGVGYTGKNDLSKMVCSRHFDVSCSSDTTTGFFLDDVFLSRRHGPQHALGVRTPLLSSVGITPHHRCLEADMAWDPLASVGHADIFLDLARGSDCTSRTSHCRFSEGRSRCSRHISCQRKWHTDIKDLVVALVVGQWSSSFNTSTSGTQLSSCSLNP